MHRKKIVIVIEYLTPEIKGLSDVWARVEVLCANFDVLVITRAPQLKKSLKSSRVMVFPWSSKSMGSFAFYLSCWLFIWLLKYDWLFLAEMQDAPSVLFTRKNKTIFYGNVHPFQFSAVEEGHTSLRARIKRFVYLQLVRLSLIRARKILAISPQLREVYISLGATPSRVTIQPMGVNLSLFSPGSNRSTDFFRCIYTGELTRTRGSDELMDATKIVSGVLPSFRLRILGVSNDNETNLSAKASKLGIRQNIEILPSVGHSEVPNYLKDCHIGISLLYPTAYYSCSPPTKIFEYMASGLPVVANRISTHSDYIIHERNGLITELNAEAIAAAILRLAKDTDLRKCLSIYAQVDCRMFEEGPIIKSFINEFE